MLIFVASILSLVLAHPFHTSLAEAHWNAAGDRLQVSLRLTPRDLDYALTSTSDRKIVLENLDAQEVREVLEAYLRDRIYLSRNEAESLSKDEELLAERRKRFHYVGVEQEARYTWVYFELERPTESPMVWISNRVMFEADKTQINTLTLMKSNPPISLQTTREEPGKRLPSVVQ